jgi:hypothetical protein
MATRPWGANRTTENRGGAFATSGLATNLPPAAEVGRRANEDSRRDAPEEDSWNRGAGGAKPLRETTWGAPTTYARKNKPEENDDSVDDKWSRAFTKSTRAPVREAPSYSSSAAPPTSSLQVNSRAGAIGKGFGGGDEPPKSSFADRTTQREPRAGGFGEDRPPREPRGGFEGGERRGFGGEGGERRGFGGEGGERRGFGGEGGERRGFGGEGGERRGFGGEGGERRGFGGEGGERRGFGGEGGERRGFGGEGGERRGFGGEGGERRGFGGEGGEGRGRFGGRGGGFGGEDRGGRGGRGGGRRGPDDREWENDPRFAGKFGREMNSRFDNNRGGGGGSSWDAPLPTAPKSSLDAGMVNAPPAAPIAIFKMAPTKEKKNKGNKAEEETVDENVLEKRKTDELEAKKAKQEAEQAAKEATLNRFSNCYNIVKESLASGLKGKSLTDHVLSLVGANRENISPEGMVKAVLESLNGDYTSKKWYDKDNCGNLLATAVHKAAGTKEEIEVAVLYAVQEFCAEKNFPKVELKAGASKRLIELLMTNLLVGEVVDVEGIIAWADDTSSNDFKGRGDAIIQTTGMITTLRASLVDEESEVDSDEDFDAPQAHIK